MFIDGATLTIYVSDENLESNEINLDLNKQQLKLIQKVLGLKIDLETGLANMYGNDTLESIYEFFNNKFKDNYDEE